jgi:PHP family Zn ribbon phosphoesterase
LVDEDSNSWECSKCREWWMLNVGSPVTNKMDYCPRCGATIVGIKVETIEELVEKMPENTKVTKDYFAISNGELDDKPALGDTVKCKICKKYHDVEYGDIIEKDGSKTESKMLAFVKCPKNGKNYLVGINGKMI